MIQKFAFRLVLSAGLAVLLMLSTYVLTSAADLPQAEIPSHECATCHTAISTAWSIGSHGTAATNSIFVETWQNQGSPAECLKCHATAGLDTATGLPDHNGITCKNCHGDAVYGHPETASMPVGSDELCSECHTETAFEWGLSRHGEDDIACTSCHNPHTAAIKASTVTGLCANCHQERSASYTHSSHSQQGLTCADCHLTSETHGSVPGKEGLNHSFAVNVATCDGCHAVEIHAGIPAQAQPTPTPDAMASAHDLEVAAMPQPVSPAGFSAFAGLIGIAFGIVLAPWIERMYTRSRFLKDR